MGVSYFSCIGANKIVLNEYKKWEEIKKLLSLSISWFKKWVRDMGVSYFSCIGANKIVLNEYKKWGKSKIRYLFMI